MNRCPNCGNKLSDIDVLCPKCGTFVEVVQSVDGNIASAEPANNDKSPLSADDDSRPEIILYNEDLPADDAKNDEINIPDTFTQISNEPEFDELDNSVDDIESSVPPVPNDDSWQVEEPEDPYAINDSYSVQDTPQPIPHESISSGDTALDESIYSDSYLEMIKNMTLPEVDDLSEFDPEAFMQAYRETKDASETSSISDIDAPDDDTPDLKVKRWLELEDVNDTPDDTNIASDIASDAYYDDTDAIPMYEGANTDADTGTDEPEAIQDDNAESSSDWSEMYTRNTDEDSDLTRSTFLSKSNDKKPRRKLFTLLIVFIWIVVAASFLFGFVVLDRYITDTYGSYSHMIDEISGGRIIVNTVKTYQSNATVDVSQTETEDGQSAHLFHIEAPVGHTIILQPLGESFPLIDGEAQMTILDSLLFSSLGEQTENATYSTDAFLFVVETSQEQYTLPVDTVTLQLKPTHYVRSLPAQSFLSTADNSIDISITVAPETNVSINGIDYTKDIGTDGLLNVNVDLLLGDNIFDIEAEQSGRILTKDSFTVTRQVSQTKLIPVTEYLRIYSDSFTSFGETDPDAEVLALIDNQGAYSAYVDSDGAYSLSCNVDGYGLHEVRLTATNEGNAKATAYMRVEYIPEVDTFVLDAQTLSLRDAARNTDGALIRISGSLGDLQTDGTTQLFTATDNGASLDCYYYGTSALEEGKSYNIYGIYDTEQSAFYAMYVL